MSNTLQGIRVVLADDHAVVRLGFRLLLEGAGATVVGESCNGEGVVSSTRTTSRILSSWMSRCPVSVVWRRLNAC